MDEFNQRNKEVYNFFNSIKSKNIIRVFPTDFFCDSKTKTCLSHKDGKVFYHDPVHVNLYGAQEIVNLIENFFFPLYSYLEIVLRFYLCDCF